MRPDERITRPLRALHEFVEKHAAHTPNAIAVRSQQVALTYGELNHRANQLADLLRGHRIGPEARVGICLPRTGLLPVAVLGVLKSRGCYVPLDPDDPPARTRRIVADAEPRVIVATPETADALPAATPTVLLDADLSVLAAHADHDVHGATDLSTAAYLLYTSGSTGQPKGVVVEHRNLSSYVLALVQRLDIDCPTNFALVQPLSVDSSLTALAVPMLTGGEVHVISRQCGLDAGALADWVLAHDVDGLKIAPSHLRSLQGSPRFPELLPRRLLVVGGEPSPWPWLRDLHRNAPCRVVNHYGPTETTVGVLTLAVEENLDADWVTAPIGRPLPGTWASVVDESGNEVPLGAVGELVVGGPNVARGYHGEPERTDAAFITDERGRRYRTGDHTRRLPEGVIAFVGRGDDQVKLRGFRVELGEIDAALSAHPGVRAAVSVLAKNGSGPPTVIAYIEWHESTATSIDELVVFIRERLPAHMMPQRTVALAELPRSTHGKVDRAALLALCDTESSIPFVEALPAADGDVERLVSAIWTDLLGVDRVGADQHFFDVGGHSLLLIELHHRLQALCGREFELAELFQHTTVRTQADLIARPIRTVALDTRPVGQHRAALARRRAQRLRSRLEPGD